MLAVNIWDEISSWFGDSSQSSETSPLSAPPTNSDLSRARLSPKNQTGGTSLYSRNFGWGTGLAGLSGRGLDAGFGISYNSLSWIRVGNEMIFNPNNDNVSAGFRFGFPVIEPQYADTLTGKNTFLMVTPSGSRVEFRQVDGTTDTFETADSSYLQLKIVDSNNLLITGTDGTTANYQLKGGAFRCASIKDANGNFITINHDNNGLLQTVTDTLGRVISVTYDAQGSPIAITQTRASGTFPFATLTYTNLTINTNFSGLTMVGIANGTNLKVLQKLTFADGSFTTFDYNSYGQVWKVSNFAADNHPLNYSTVNLDNTSVSSVQSDVPRFSEMRNWTENFNLNSSGIAQEVVIPIVYQENASFTLPSGSGATGTLLQVTAPDGVISKTFVGGNNSGWMEGIPIQTEDWANNVRQRWSWTNYTQDNPSLAYILNPRVIESKIGDAANVRRTTIDYLTQSGNSQASYFGLVGEVKVYDSNQTTILKRSTTEYNLNTAYLNKRIIGLPQKSELFDNNNALQAKVTYAYDEGDFSGTGQTISPINHDTTNFGAGFIVGRGNATSSTRWDVTDPNNSSKSITSQVKYNTAGNPVSSLDPLNREIKTSYTDSFDDNVNRNSFAYPTQITDPAGNSSTVKYKFDTGANVYAQSPAPAGQSIGKQTSRIYDNLGRLEKEIVLNTGAYTRYEYPSNGIQSKVFSTITDVNNSNTADSADEVLSESFSDGAGRTRMARSEHPNSAGEWSGTITEYDIMGRVKRSSVPTEVNSSWTPAGDDATRGFIWTTQEYDWKGRVTRQINTDGTDKLISYEGCGCAGGQVTTVSGEQLAEGRRRQKVYEDILGRTFKSETLNWDGSVYSTNKSFFNGRDQVTTARQYAGNDSSSTFQDTIMTYDGHARLKTQHRPEQNSGTVTTYNYFNDDRIQQVVDARGATVNYSYDVRGLTTQVSTTSPNTATIPVTPTVSFVYDNLGNRTSMTDGLGNVTYSYDQLSRLTAETRQFNDSLPNAPIAGNKFKLEYGYSLSGQLKFYKDAYGQQINYSQDKIGRLSAVTGSTSFGGVSTYANNPSYRAWGALKTLSYGDGMQMTTSFNNRLQATSYNLAYSGGTLMNRNYQYYADGGFKYMQDVLNPKFDRLQIYDHLGRIKEGKSGAEARGQTAASPLTDNLPYRQSYQYNAFGQMTQRNNLHWGRTEWDESFNLNYSYNNNRDATWTYDADGNAISRGGFVGNNETSVYDSTGQMTKLTSESTSTYPHTFPPPEESVTQIQKNETYRFYGGDGRELKRIEKSCVKNANLIAPCEWTEEPPRYFVRSSVFGNETISEVNSIGKKLKTFIKAGDTTLAWQALTHKHPGGFQDYNPPLEAVYFERYDASGMSRRVNNNYGIDNLETDPVENDPLGGNVGIENPYQEEAPPPEGNGDCKGCDNNGNFELQESSLTTINGQQRRCMQDGLTVPCAQVRRELESGRLGGAFGALERGAVASAPKLVAVGVRTGDGPMIGGPEDEGRLEGVARQTGETLHRFFVVSDNWSLNYAMTPAERKPQTGQQQETPQKKLDNAKYAVGQILAENGFDNPCAKFFGDGLVASQALDSINFTFSQLSKVSTGISMGLHGLEWEIKNGFTYGDYYVKKGYVRAVSAIINTKGAFITSNRSYDMSKGRVMDPSKFGGFEPDTLGSRIVQLLHEIGHLVIKSSERVGGNAKKNKPPKKLIITPVLEVDGDDETKSESNTTKMLNACRTQINNYLNRQTQ